jgi:hypothetical protein
VKWTRPMPVQRVTDPCFVVDPVIARCVMDGIAGAPTGADATTP